MTLFSMIRLILFSISIVFSLIVLGLDAYFLSVTVPLQFYFTFSALGVATAVLTILTVPIMLIVDLIRHGAVTSMIVVELVWLSILWVLWVATAGEAANGFNLYFPRGCIYATDDPTANAYCMELQAVQAFAFLNFFIFLGYTCTLLVLSIISASRGKSVWTSSVKQSTFLAPSSGPVQQVPLAQYSGAPAPGYTGTPVSQPQQPGTYTSYSGPPAQSPYTQPQQFQPVHNGQQQGIPV
ncbi:hypothetical protein DFH29DRAFT_844631 [Suillus ampliporus]|nr:hypothetical protein DFH29DRAFT_844631 [Suillus ampliporus]